MSEPERKLSGLECDDCWLFWECPHRGASPCRTDKGSTLRCQVTGEDADCRWVQVPLAQVVNGKTGEVDSVGVTHVRVPKRRRGWWARLRRKD